MAESDAVIDYNSDTRAPCKYGSSCYRKNKTHLEKFKHPPGTCEDDSNNAFRPKKKQKMDTNSYTTVSAVGTELEKEKKQLSSPGKTNATGAVTLPENSKQEVEERLRERIDDYSEECEQTKDDTRCPKSKKLELGSSSKEIIKQLFLVEMPNDFYSFWEMCKQLNSTEPSNALKDIKLSLVGPFDVLAGKVKEVYEENLPAFLRHWRFYYDPPECQTVLASSAPSCYHIGYFRDEPSEMPVFVVSNLLNSKNPEKNGELKVIGPNLFAALNAYLEELETDPFSRMKVPKYKKILNEWSTEKGFSLGKTSKQMEARARKVVAKTFHTAGIVVPFDKKSDIGYRELAASNATIKKILKGIVESKSEEERIQFWEQLQPVMTFANIANDECDFGTCLELGLDLFSYGSDLLHRSILQLLPTAYNLLQRPQFAAILQAHIEDRKKGNKLSII